MAAAENFCCAMRRHFLVGIVGARAGDPPVEHLDFMIEFDPPVITIKFCPFCGKDITRDQTVRFGTQLDNHDQDEER